MELNFKGKTALVTGAAAGIGRAVAIRFAQYGAKVAILDLNEEKLEYVKKEIEAYTKDVIALKCDISQESEVYEAVKKAEDTLGNIDILVNNAAIWRYLDSFTNVSTDEWRKYMDINVMGTVYCTKAVLSKMLENRYGKIVNVASVAGVYGIANMVHYSATKGAVIAMTRALAKEVIDKGVYVNCVSPGSVSPAENLDMDYYEDSQHCFLGRTGTDNENTNLICFLASDEATYIAGQNIQIDGCRKKQ
jgi:NAD(P)-dependent dehydrogenase (short-subunit alcohol dehydrogenase family)